MKLNRKHGLLLAAVMLLSPTLKAAENLGAGSPEAVVERLRAAAVKEDFAELAACLAPEARAEMAKGIWIGTTMMIAMGSAMGDLTSGLGEAVGEAMGEATEESKAQAAKAKKELEEKFGVWKKRYDEVAKKHGLPALDAGEIEGDPGELLAKADHVGLIRDFGELLKNFGEQQGGQKKGKNIEGQLEGLKIDGDAASGTLDGDEIHFVKIGGRWFIAALPGEMQGGEN